MSWLQAVVLGLVQGLTEFLPISSTAHLRIVPALLGWSDPGAAYSAVIQLGTVGAVLVYFARDLLSLTKAFAKDVIAFLQAVVAMVTKRQPLSVGFSGLTSHESRLAWYVGLGTLPIGVLGLLLKKAIESTLRSLYVIAFSLIALAVVLFIVERLAKHARALEDITLKDGLIIGLCQACALIPGSSRSGTTLTGGLALGFTREAAARYSFLLSIPATTLAGVFELKHLLQAPERPATALLVIGTLVAFVSGLAAISGLLAYLRTRSTVVFVAYRIIVGVALLVLLSRGLIAA